MEQLMIPLYEDILKLAREVPMMQPYLAPLMRSSRIAKGEDASIWFEIARVQNISVKEYEDPNQGEFSVSGDFKLKGALHVQPSGASWSSAFQITATMSVTGNPSTGHTSFHVEDSNNKPVARLLQMVLLGGTGDQVMEDLGVLELVPFQTKVDPKEQAHQWLSDALKKSKLPTEGGQMRKVSPREFALMTPTAVKMRGQRGLWWQFKHHDTRNYVLINADTGKMVVPRKPSVPFMHGTFDKFASVNVLESSWPPRQ